MEGEINSNKSTNPAKDVAASNAPSCKNPLRPPPTNLNTSIPHISLSPPIPLHTSLFICIFNRPNPRHHHHHKLSVHSILFLGRDHTLYASILIFYYPFRSVFLSVCAGGRECKIETNGDLLALLSAFTFFICLFFSVLFLVVYQPLL